MAIDRDELARWWIEKFGFKISCSDYWNDNWKNAYQFADSAIQQARINQP